MHARHIAMLLPFLAIPCMSAHASNFKVYSPVVESGVTEVEYRGFRDFDRRDEINRRQTHLLGVGRGFTDYWAGEVYGEFEKEEGNESLKLESFELESRFQFAPQGKYWADTGLLVEYEHPVHHGDPGEFTVAPLIEKELTTRLIATLNLRFTREVGSNAAPGTEFGYGARLKYNLHPRFEPALEFFGNPGRINHFPTRSEQPHWIGPAFYGKVGIGHHGETLSYSAAALFATTSAASDKRAIFRVEYEF